MVSKHVDIKYHFIREAVGTIKVELVYCRTDMMIADMFTEGLAKQRL